MTAIKLQMFDCIDDPTLFFVAESTRPILATSWTLLNSEETIFNEKN